MITSIRDYFLRGRARRHLRALTTQLSKQEENFLVQQIAERVRAGDHSSRHTKRVDPFLKEMASRGLRYDKATNPETPIVWLPPQAGSAIEIRLDQSDLLPGYLFEEEWYEKEANWVSLFLIIVGAVVSGFFAAVFVTVLAPQTPPCKVIIQK